MCFIASEMTWYQEIKPYFIRSKIRGFFPFSYVDGHLVQSKVAYGLTVIAAIYEMMIIGWATNNLIHWNKLAIREAFIITYSLFLGLALSHTSYKCLKNCIEMRATMDLIGKYDDTVRRSPAIRKIVIFSWMTIVGYPIQEFSKAAIDYNPETYVDTLWFISIIERSLISTNMVMQFTAIVFSLARRFRKLHSLVTSDGSIILDEMSNDYRPLYLEDVRRLHGYLVTAAKKVNSMFTFPLLLWIFILSTQLIWSMYDLLMLNNPLNIIVKTVLYFGVDFVVLVVLLIACNEASTQANKLGHVVLSPNSGVLRLSLRHEKYKNFLTGQYFMLNPLHFSAAWGLLCVDLQLLYTLFGGITTVLVILCGS